jgi:hypothetical protein
MIRKAKKPKPTKPAKKARKKAVRRKYRHSPRFIGAM